MKIEEIVEKLKVKLNKYTKVKGRYILGVLVIAIAITAIFIETLYSLSGSFFLGEKFWGIVLLGINAASAGYSVKLNEERKIELTCLKGEIETISCDLGLNLSIDELLTFARKNGLYEMVYNTMSKTDETDHLESEVQLSSNNEGKVDTKAISDDMSFEETYSSLKKDLSKTEEQKEDEELQGWKTYSINPDSSMIEVPNEFYMDSEVTYINEDEIDGQKPRTR